MCEKIIMQLQAAPLCANLIAFFYLNCLPCCHILRLLTTIGTSQCVSLVPIVPIFFCHHIPQVNLLCAQFVRTLLQLMRAGDGYGATWLKRVLACSLLTDLNIVEDWQKTPRTAPQLNVYTVANTALCMLRCLKINTFFRLV